MKTESVKLRFTYPLTFTFVTYHTQGGHYDKCEVSFKNIYGKISLASS